MSLSPLHRQADSLYCTTWKALVSPLCSVKFLKLQAVSRTRAMVGHPDALLSPCAFGIHKHAILAPSASNSAFI